MRHAARRIVFVGMFAIAGSAAAQIGAFEWTLAGNPGGSGFATPTNLHVVGPDNSACTPHVTYFETVLPVGGTLSVLVDFQNLDSWVYKGHADFDGPAWVIDGAFELPPYTGQPGQGVWGWPTGAYVMEFEAEAGQHVGFGAWASDCLEGPGVADYHDLVLTPKPWSTHAAALDPRKLWTAPLNAFSPLLIVAGDVDLDGTDDLLITGGFTSQSGQLRFVSALDGTPLLTFASLYTSFEAVAAIGDLDGDGRADVAAGNSATNLPGASTAGSVRVFSGADGSEILAAFGTLKNDKLGERVAGVGDVDLDGIPDLAVRLAKKASTKSAVRVLSGATGAVLAEWLPTQPLTTFGLGLAGPGDASGDGIPDVAVGAPGSDISLFSGGSGLLDQTFATPGPTDFGRVLVPAGDVDGGGESDLLVGCPGDSLGLGAIVVLSLETGAALSVIEDDSTGGFGGRLAGGVDATGDGRIDLVAGSTGLPTGGPALPPGGLVRVFDALDGSLRAQFEGLHKHDQLGFGVALPADVDGDGLGDVIAVTLPYDSAEQAEFRAFGNLDHVGPPQVAGSGLLVPHEQVTITISNAAPGAAGFLVVGGALLDVPAAGGVLAPSPDLLIPVVAGPTGTADVGARWPAGLPVWTSFWMQAWMHDPAGPAGFTASDALAASQL